MKAIFCKALERFKICHPAMARQFGIELTNRRVYSRELSFGDSCANADQRPERFVQGDMNGAILLLALGRRLVHHDCTVPLAGSAQGLGQLVSTTLEVAIACRPALTRPGLPRASMDDSRPPTDLAVLAGRRHGERRTTVSPSAIPLTLSSSAAPSDVFPS
jgi:hypothetical protein